MRGFDTIVNVYKLLLLYTKNLNLTYHHSQKALYFYIEFVGQILEDGKTFLQLTSKDATIYVYKKTIYEINHEQKQTHSKIAKKCSEKLEILNEYVSICYIYINKTVENYNINISNVSDFVSILKQNLLLYTFQSFQLNIETITLIKKILSRLSYLIDDIDIFFKTCNYFFAKIHKSPTCIIYIHNTVTNLQKDNLITDHLIKLINSAD